MMELETFFTVPEQTRLLIFAVLLGIPLGFCFDILRTLRVLISHGRLATALEDIVFLLLWGISLLCFSTVLARGELRGYYAMGSALGFLLYRCTLGCVTVPLLRRIFGAVGCFLRWLTAPLFHGIVRICGGLKENFGHFAKLSGKASFFSHLPLIGDGKMLYNKTDRSEQEAARRWQRQNRRKKNNHAGSSGSSAGQQ
ncbi:spore cortex biosynthesis protein YabQ [Ruminococcus sp.]|uniref:spore cortex biosynthesis protein YabQ n=1 Tax=Ruminococcus sp. TaxID=41978 RepID=UPI0025FDEAE1|nr:spore cortex biosynthesis protein YabQ [Ruminococcus sp.]